MLNIATTLAKAVLTAQLATAGVGGEVMNDVQCMARNVWFEARSGDVEAKAAVAEVVLNRVRSDRYPDTVCEVVWQPWQFSWTKDGKTDRIRIKNPIDERAWSESVAVAIAAVKGTAPRLTYGATHYHALYVNPAWAGALMPTADHGGHRFYKKPVFPIPRPSVPKPVARPI